MGTFYKLVFSQMFKYIVHNVHLVVFLNIWSRGCDEHWEDVPNLYFRFFFKIGCYLNLIPKLAMLTVSMHYESLNSNVSA